MTSPSTRSRSRTKKAATPPTRPPAEDLEELVPSSPLFQQPADPEPGLMHPLEMTDGTTVDVPWSSPGDSGPMLAGVDDSPSVTPSTDNPPKASKLGRAAVRRYAQKVLAVAGNTAHQVLTARESIERDAGLWVPDDEDLRDMADPVAGLAVRRLPAKMGAANPDVEDLITLAIAVGNYFMKQLAKRAELAARAAEFADMPADLGPDPAVA